MASQCGVDSTKFLQWHSSVGLFQLSFSSGVQVYPASIRWVAQRYPSVHWVNQWHSSGIPVYTGPPSVHWLRIRAWFNIASGNGLSPFGRQAITWTIDDSLLIGLQGTNFSWIEIKIQKFHSEKMHLKTSSAKWWSFCPGGRRGGLKMRHLGLTVSMMRTKYVRKTTAWSISADALTLYLGRSKYFGHQPSNL